MAYPYDYGEYGRGTDPRWRRDDDWDERRSWTERDWAERRRDPRVAGRRFGGAEYRERSQGGERDRENREEVLHGGDRGWPGGVRGAEGGAGYGRGWFAEAYGLYSGRPEQEQRGRWERTGHSIDEEPWRRRLGRGPKGYRRSDERILDDVSERMAWSGIDADEVEVRVENGVVTLSGSVEYRQDKHRLEDVCESVFGVSDVVNNLRVPYRTGHPQDREPSPDRGIH